MQYKIAFVVLALAWVPARAADTPYAGQERRPIKALSEQDIADYRSGRGMGASLAAELNHYPGPRHVLDHAQALGLSNSQKGTTQQLYDDMAREAARLGELIVAKEAELETLFAGAKASHDNTAALVREIGALQAEYRLVHLGAHLSMRAVLSPEQVADYDKLRGYQGTNPGQGGHKHGMMHGKTGHH
ncbi:Spy/CpxP family protein refolding chaperone [Noviherbaspirillum sp. ST9]|uniref:Spy/CpxP family protein refolding chaperone n=1 Tax=Noviherbaspirillum sp. ST9 TaxID=3401606 RepID=UPI003B58A4CE